MPSDQKMTKKTRGVQKKKKEEDTCNYVRFESGPCVDYSLVVQIHIRVDTKILSRKRETQKKEMIFFHNNKL